MGQQIIRQPNGLYAVWSTVVDDFVLVNATPAEIIFDRVREATLRISDEVEKTVSQLEAGEKPYFQFTMSWEGALMRILTVNDQSEESTKRVQTLATLGCKPVD